VPAADARSKAEGRPGRGPRVAYDVSVLGLGRAGLQPATGISRVVESVARALCAAGGCELRFCAAVSALARSGAADYLRAEPACAGVPLLGGESAAARRLRGPLARLARAADPGLAARAARRLLAHAAGGLTRLRPPLAPADLEGVQVYHSPFHALPRASEGVRGLARFLTVYDLIPVLHPEFFEFRGEHFLLSVLRSLRPGDWALAISERTRADLLEFRPDLDPARVRVTPLAADPRLFYPVGDPERIGEARARHGVPEGPYLLSLNTLEPRKNLDRLVRAFARLAGEEGARDLSLVLVGGRGWKTGALFRAIEEAGPVRSRIVLAGYVADEDLAPLYSGATAFVYPSLYEGFGLPPLEAMQCGVPVIASGTSALPEVVGDAGILVDPRDADALCQAMLEVYRDAALRERLRARSLARAARFSWERCARQTLAAYRAALAG
jgi:glycosyltransferase involved in cell wall biosynthesis